VKVAVCISVWVVVLFLSFIARSKQAAVASARDFFRERPKARAAGAPRPLSPFYSGTSRRRASTMATCA